MSLSNQNEGSLFELVELITNIESEAPRTKINETSISDNNGGRIEL